ncbi:hypothetical protein GCM10020331_009770 [Ectobacillus funiculus]
MTKSVVEHRDINIFNRKHYEFTVNVYDLLGTYFTIRECSGAHLKCRIVQGMQKELGITFVVEPQAADSNLIESADDALLFAEEVGESNVKVMFDTFHALYRSEVPSDYVYRMADKLHHVHISDNDRLPPGQGSVNF